MKRRFYSLQPVASGFHRRIRPPEPQSAADISNLGFADKLISPYLFEEYTVSFGYPSKI